MQCPKAADRAHPVALFALFRIARKSGCLAFLVSTGIYIVERRQSYPHIQVSTTFHLSNFDMFTLTPVAAGSVTCLPLLQQPTLRRYGAARTTFMATQCSTCEPRNVSTNDIVRSRILKRREALAVVAVVAFQGLAVDSSNSAVPEPELARICDVNCEQELENIATTTTSSGLQYKDITVGKGPSPPVGFQVTANYVAMVPSGKVFDSSLEKGNPYIFRVGAGQVIKGLDEGLLSMKVGGVRRLYIPGELAYPKGLSAAAGRPRVPPNSPVVFDVSLLYVPGLDFDDSEESE